MLRLFNPHELKTVLTNTLIIFSKKKNSNYDKATTNDTQRKHKPFSINTLTLNKQANITILTQKQNTI